MNANEARKISDRANSPREADQDSVSDTVEALMEQIQYRARRGYTTLQIQAGLAIKPDCDIRHGATAKAIRARLEELDFIVKLDIKNKLLEISW